MNDLKALSPTEFLGQVKFLLESTYKHVVLKGEIINLSGSASGHFYFSLADKNASISVALFRGDALRNPLIKSLKNGDEVVITGPLGLYVKRGSFQLIAKTITKVGKGDLKAQFEALKVKLASEGLFDLESKLTIPNLPKKIAIITSPKGAALQDFINVYKNRSHWMDLTIFPAVVQGEKCAESVVRALHAIIKRQKDFDVIVITRGGGSIEDLWGFNDEGLAYEIFNCPLPVVSAVGHEVDFSICDFVSDLRVETPTAAATLLTNSQVELIGRMDRLKKDLRYSLESKIYEYKQTLNEMEPRKTLNSIVSRINAYQFKLQKLNIFKNIFETLGVYENYYILDDLVKRIQTSIKQKLSNLETQSLRLNELMSAFNPKNVMARGYSFVEHKDKIIKTRKEFKKLKQDSKLKIHFYDGVGDVGKLDD